MAGERSARVVPAAEQGRQLGQVADLRIRRAFAIPGLALGVEPDGAHAGVTGAVDVVAGVVANVHRLRGCDACAFQRLLERVRVGFADAQLLGAQGELEVVGQAQAAHVGVAVGDHRQAIAVGEYLQGRVHLGEQVDAVTCVEEDVEAPGGQGARFVPGVAGLFQGMEQDALAQLTEAVLECRLGRQQARADSPQVLDGHRPELRRLQGQPLTQGRFGAVHHGGDVPEGVVEVEGDQLDAHSSFALLRLARGWALS